MAYKVKIVGPRRFTQIHNIDVILNIFTNPKDIDKLKRSRMYPGNPDDILELWEEHPKTSRFMFSRIIKRRDIYEVYIEPNTKYYVRRIHDYVYTVSVPGCTRVFYTKRSCLKFSSYMIMQGYRVRVVQRGYHLSKVLIT